MLRSSLTRMVIVITDQEISLGQIEGSAFSAGLLRMTRKLAIAHRTYSVRESAGFRDPQSRPALEAVLARHLWHTDIAQCQAHCGFLLPAKCPAESSLSALEPARHSR